MKLIVGLGNPGVDYVNTRHNVGFVVVDSLLKNKPIKDVILRKTNVFMNQSGTFISELCTKYSVLSTDLYVIHDDLDIPLGQYKIQFAKGPKDHNGIKSINEALGTDEYWHIRIGIDNRPQDSRPMGEEYVLQNFTDQEKTILDPVIKEICKKLATL